MQGILDCGEKNVKQEKRYNQVGDNVANATHYLADGRPLEQGMGNGRGVSQPEPSPDGRPDYAGSRHVQAIIVVWLCIFIRTSAFRERRNRKAGWNHSRIHKSGGEAISGANGQGSGK